MKKSKYTTFLLLCSLLLGLPIPQTALGENSSGPDVTDIRDADARSVSGEQKSGEMQKTKEGSEQEEIFDQEEFFEPEDIPEQEIEAVTEPDLFEENEAGNSSQNQAGEDRTTADPDKANTDYANQNEPSGQTSGNAGQSAQNANSTGQSEQDSSVSISSDQDPDSAGRSGQDGQNNPDGDEENSPYDPAAPDTPANNTELEEDRQSALIQTLLLLRLRFGSSFTYGMRIPEDIPTPETVQPRSLIERSRELPGYPIPSLPETIHDLENQLNDLTASYSGQWSVYVKNLTTGDVLIVNDKPMKSASIMKLFIMAAVYEDIDRGELERTSELVDQLSNMISYSSNEAANRLLRKLGGDDVARGVDRVNRYIREHGYSGMSHEYNGFQDSNMILDTEHFNQISARDCGILLEQVYHRTFGSRKVCNEIEEMMLKQQTRYKIPRGLPEGVLVGNKTGEMDTVENDVAVIYAKKADYILCILSSDWFNKDTAQRNIQEISSTVYRFFDDEEYYQTDALYRVETLPPPEDTRDTSEGVAANRTDKDLPQIHAKVPKPHSRGQRELLK